MNNLEEELLELLLKDFKEEISKSKKINDILNITKEGTANFADSLLFTKECGKCIEKAFHNNISDDVLADKKMSYDLAKLLIGSITKENYEIVTYQCTSVQTTLNKKANIGLKSIKPKYNEEKVEGIITYISNAKVYSEKEESFLDTLSTNSKSIVDDHVRMNADFHYNAGLSPKIIRTTVGKTCKWCRSLAGVYDYSKVKNTGNDVFKRHANCDCTVVYDPQNGSKRVQDVWSKSLVNDAVVTRRIAIANKIKSDKIITGARITNPDSKEAVEWAKSYYDEIRHKSTDYIKIANRMGITIDEARKIKQYLFINKSVYDEELKIWVRFDEDPAIAQSWQRLAEGKKILPHDETLINHELYEMQIKEANPNISHIKAHELAQSKYNYKKETLEYYDNINKSKKRK